MLSFIRLWFFLQGVDHFKKIMYAEGITYGELFLENEYVSKRFTLKESEQVVEGYGYILFYIW